MIQAVKLATNLRVDVQDAGAACIHHLMDRVNLGAVKVSIILAVFQVAALFDVFLHFLPRNKAVVLAIPILFPWTT